MGKSLLSAVATATAAKGWLSQVCCVLPAKRICRAHSRDCVHSGYSSCDAWHAGRCAAAAAAALTGLLLFRCQEVAAQAHKLSIISTESMLHEKHACNCCYGPRDSSRLLTPAIFIWVCLQPGCHAAQLLLLLLR